MSFLDENMVVTDDPAKAEALAKKGVMVKLVDSVDEKLDPVGKEDGDIDNDGDQDKTDSYLAKRRAAIKKALKKEMAKPETTDQKIQAFLDKVRDDMDARYGRNPDAKNTLTKPPTNEGNCGCGQTPCQTYGQMKEDKKGKDKEFNYKAPKDIDNDDIKIDPDTKFKVDLKHLIQKHMSEGKSKDQAITITKKLMAKLHDKGKVKVDGTMLIFKEADVPMDAQVDLPEPKEPRRKGAPRLVTFDTDAPDYLGNDDFDYEGGMAKSQMLKMKNYAKALCDMIEDETQLEAWVQAKLTKASDYMSSVYHYLNYQKSKMNEDINPKDIDWDDIEPDTEDRLDYKAGTIYGTNSQGKRVAADGYYTPGEGYIATGDIELA